MKRQRHVCISILLVGLVAGARSAVAEPESRPTPPNRPDGPATVRLSNLGDQESTTPERETPGISIRVSIVLGNGREVTGTTELRTPETLVVRHTRDGILYEKTISIRDIASIELKRWEGRLVAQRSEGDLYRFSVRDFQIEMRDGYQMTVQGNFLPFLDQVVLVNANGSVTLFSYWLDLLREDGTWFTGLSGPVAGTRVVCHEDVIKKILFPRE